MALTITIPGAVEATIGATAPAILTVGVGVPGATGATGATGAQGPQGEPGEGVPAGGSAGQVLAKVDGVDYNTEWINVDVSGYRTLTDYDFTNVADTRLTGFGMTLSFPSGTTHLFDSYLTPVVYRISYDASNEGTTEGPQVLTQYGESSFYLKRQDWANVDGEIIPTLGYGALFDASSGLKFINWNGTTQSGTMQYGKTGITFGNGSVQTIAFPGFNNTALTGTPTAPTAALADNDTSIATTAFVQQELASGTANARNLEVYARNQTGSTIPIGSIVYINGATGNRPTITLAQANNDANSAQTIGFTKTAIANNGFGFVIVRGELENLNTSALTEGAQLYLSPTTAGTWTTTKPYAPSHLVYVGIVIRSHPTLGAILVSVQNGYEVAELHDSAISGLANNDLFAYESSTDLWKNKSFSALGLLTTTSIGNGSAVAGATILASLQNANAPSSDNPMATIGDVSTQVNSLAVSSALRNNNLSDLSNVTTARTNLGLGTMATQTAANYALLNSPSFSGVPLAPTASLGTNNQQIASTAFVTAAVPAFATNEQAIVTSSATTALSPFNSRFSQLAPFVYAPVSSSLTSVTSGGGSSTMYPYGGSLGSSSSLAGYVLRYTNPYMRGVTTTGGIQWQKPNMFAVRLVPFFAFQTASIFRMTIGSNTATLNVLANKGIGVSFGASATNTLSALVLDVHNGTTLTSVTSSFTPVLAQAFDVMVYSDGAGNVTLYANDVQVATTSAGPSTAAIANYNILQIGIENTTTLTTGSNVSFGSLKTFIS